MNALDYITALMPQAYESVGFIPATTIASRYIANERYVLQTDTRGVPVGYILHGSVQPGGLLTIAQALIDYDMRQRGHGFDAVRTVIERAQAANCRAIKLRCAADLEANAFWLAAGFTHTGVLTPDNKRRRAINVYSLDLWPVLPMFA